MIEKTYDRIMCSFVEMSDMEIEIVKRRKQLLMGEDENEGY